MIVQPAQPAKGMPVQKGEKIEGPKGKVAVDAPATIVVSLPADARLIVDGAATTSTSAVRTLVTPVLVNGSDYVYTMQAEITREGRVQTQSQQVTVRSGETSNVQFNFSTSSVASR
ncbi:MAG TPA: TIGR03000 domain-containing protein [Gemmataceae bacterium]|nr:TIGR03000 domain-containing protein [Gemmataceae bacterium]